MQKLQLTLFVSAAALFAVGCSSSSSSDGGTTPVVDGGGGTTGGTDAGGTTGGTDAGGTTGGTDAGGGGLTGVNLLTNGGFESGSSSIWVFNVSTLQPGDGGTAIAAKISDEQVPANIHTGAVSARIDITHADLTAAPENAYWINLQQSIALAKKSTTVSFWAKASAARTIGVVLQKNGGNHDTYGIIHTPALTTSWAQVTWTYDQPVDAAAVFIQFNMANDPATVWIDDVSVIQN